MNEKTIHHKADRAFDGDYTIRKARYAKGKLAIECPGHMGLKTRAARIITAKGFGARYSRREHAYIVSPAAAKRFVAHYERGSDSNGVTGELQADYWRREDRTEAFE